MDDICFICSTEQKSWNLLLCYFSKMRFIDCLRSHEMVSESLAVLSQPFFSIKIALVYTVLAPIC